MDRRSSLCLFLKPFFDFELYKLFCVFKIPGQMAACDHFMSSCAKLLTITSFFSFSSLLFSLLSSSSFSSLLSSLLSFSSFSSFSGLPAQWQLRS